MRDLEDIVKDLAQNIQHANIDLEAANYKSRPSLTHLKNEAQGRVEKLKVEYAQRIRASSVGIFLYGDSDRLQAFTAIAEEEAGVLAVNAGELFERLAMRVEASLGASREFGPTQLQGLIEALSTLSKDMGIRSMPKPKLQDLVAVADQQELIQHVRRLVESAVEGDLLRLYVDQKVNEVAVEAQFAGSVLPVAVLGTSREDLAVLAPLFTHSVSVEVGTSEDGAVDREYVLSKLEAMKKSLKGKKS
jgi:hypothetical protein